MHSVFYAVYFSLGGKFVNDSSTKKQYERFLLEQFFSASQISGLVVDASGEAPDLIVRIDERLIGVEVSELFTPHTDGRGPLQAQEALAQRILAHASQLYRASGAQHAHVSVHFSPSSDLRRLNRDETASQLSEFVQSQMLSPDQLVQWRPDYVTHPLPDAITFVNMLGVPEPGMAHWSAPSAGWVAPLTREMLQARVDEKAALLPKYKLRVATNWLLLVSDGAKTSQLLDPPSPRVASSIVSPFERTLYFGRFKGIVVELGSDAR
jgi:hypothetical protein